MRGNVFVQRNSFLYLSIGQPFIYSRPADVPGGAYSLNPTLNIKDNIGAHVLGVNTSTMPSNKLIIHKTLTLDWLTDNSMEVYSSTDAWATNPRVYDHRRLAGTIPASGPIVTKRFVYPSQWLDRNDSFRGLG
jgi:hypothetical protein